MNDQNQDQVEKESESLIELKKEIEQLKEQLVNVTNSWKRAAADYQNLQKRVEKEKEDWLKFSNTALLSKLIGVLDNLQRAQEHLNDAGLGVVIKNFVEVLSQQGLREIPVDVGDDFDPNLEECLEMIKAETEGKVVEVVDRGYIIGERVLRPARVKVSWKDAGEMPPGAEKEMEAGN